LDHNARMPKEDPWPAIARSTFAVGSSLIALILINNSNPQIAKGFDLPLAVLLAVAIFVSPNVSIVLGLFAGLVADSFGDHLFLLHTIFYCFPALVVLTLGDALVAKTWQVGIALFIALDLVKFFVQYALLFFLGHGDWPVVLLSVNYYGTIWAGVLVGIFWRSAGTWLSGIRETAVVRRGRFGRS